MNKLKELCKGKYFKLGLIASGAISVVCLYGIVNTAILNGSIWPGIIMFVPMNIGACGMILARTAMIDNDIKNRESKQDNKFDINKIPSYTLVNDKEGLSMDDVKIYSVDPEAMGLSRTSTLEQNTEIKKTVKVKVRKRTGND